MRMYRISYSGVDSIPGTALSVVDCIRRHGLEVRRGFIGEAVANMETKGGLPFRGIFKATSSDSVLHKDDDTWAIRDEPQWMTSVANSIKRSIEEFYKESGHLFDSSKIGASVDRLSYSEKYYYYSCQVKCVNEVGLIHRILSGLDCVTTHANTESRDASAYRNNQISMSGMMHLPVYQINDNGMNCLIDFHCRVQLNNDVKRELYKQWRGFPTSTSEAKDFQPKDLIAQLNMDRWVVEEIQQRIASVFALTNGVISYSVRHTSPHQDVPETYKHKDVEAHQHTERGDWFILRYKIPAGATGVTKTVARTLRDKNYNIYRGFAAEVPQTDPAFLSPRSAVFKVYLPSKAKSLSDEDRKNLERELNTNIKIQCEDQTITPPEVIIEPRLTDNLPSEPADSVRISCQITVDDQAGTLLAVLKQIAKIAVPSQGVGESSSQGGADTDNTEFEHFSVNIDHLILLANRLEKRRKEGIIELKLSVDVERYCETGTLINRAEAIRDEIVHKLKRIASVLSVTCKPTVPSCPASGFISHRWHQ